jgi:selenocysteine-specific elongation factor
VHLGALDVTGRVALLEGEALAPGTDGLAQLVLERPVGALHGDRFVVRDQSATRTVGGGVVLDPFAPQRGRRHARRLAALRAYEQPDASARLRGLLDVASSGLDLLRFALTCNLSQEEADAAAAACGMRRVAASGFSEGGWRALRQRVLDALRIEHARTPDMIGVGRERLRRLADPALGAVEFAAVAAELLAEGALRQTGSWLHLPDHQVRLTAAEEGLWARVRPLLERTPFHPPRIRDLAHALNVEEGQMRQLLKRVSRRGDVYPVAHDHYFTREAVTQLAGILRESSAAAVEVRAAPFRDRIEVGRKLAIQILEFFDRIGYTRRVGDAHVLRQPDMFLSEAGAAVT